MSTLKFHKKYVYFFTKSGKIIKSPNRVWSGGKMGAPIYAREPENQEKEKIYKLLKEGEEHIKKRLKAIILSGIHRYKISEISKILNFHPQNLRKWIHRFNRDGLESVINSPKVGIKKKFGNDLREKIIEIVHNSPRKFGYKFSHWTLHKIKEHLEKNKMVNRISYETIRRTLKEKNIDIKKLKKNLVEFYEEL